MAITWMLGISPAAAKIVHGELVHLRIELPPFDEDTNGLHDMTVSQRVAAGWYAVECASPDVTDPMPKDPPTIYSLVSYDDVSGVAVLGKT
jgi:hypothetical protein